MRAILGRAALLVLIAGRASAAEFSLQRSASAVNDVVTIGDQWDFKVESSVSSDPILTSPPVVAPPAPPPGIRLTRKVIVREVDAAGHWRKLEVLYTAGADGELSGRSFIFDLASATVAAVDAAPISPAALKKLGADRENLGRILALDALLGGPVHEGETLAVPSAARSVVVSDSETFRVTAMSLRLESVAGDRARFAVTVMLEPQQRDGQGAPGGAQKLAGFLAIDSQGRDLAIELASTSGLRDELPGFKRGEVQATATVRLTGRRTIAPAVQ
jgi:hypothetical protein